MYIKLNQENIYYEQHGKGAKTFILLHNAGGDHQFFYPQIEQLKTLGKVIVIDLPGHGKSSAHHTEYSIAKYADLIIKFCSELEINQANIIGLNNGANIAIEIAIIKPTLIEHLILIDPPLFMDDHFVGEIKNFIQQLNGKNLDDFIEQLASALFIKSPDKNKKIAAQAFKDASVPTLTAIFNDLLEWNKTCDAKVKQLTSATLCILTDEHHCSHEKLKACNNKIVIGRVVCSRCWATLEVPEQVNAMILRFID